MKTAADYRVEFVRTAKYERTGNRVKTFQGSERQADGSFIQLGTFNAPGDTPHANLWKFIKRPTGRPEVAPEDRLEVLAVRVTAAQRSKLALLGGSTWIRSKIDRAKV